VDRRLNRRNKAAFCKFLRRRIEGALKIRIIKKILIVLLYFSLYIIIFFNHVMLSCKD